jgi:hypothetical protein|nr:MAG TPA: hypothetical protein [Caudoviricetes sp.]DAX95516.1 MAG TPA: hypothetical protein [Caudoviricetes sp.]
MWGYENDNEFYEYAISKVLEHKADELEQKEFNKLKNMIDKKENYIFKKKLQEISEAKKRVIKKFLNYEKLDDRDYSLIKTNIDFFDFKLKKVREAVI